MTVGYTRHELKIIALKDRVDNADKLVARRLNGGRLERLRVESRTVSCPTNRLLIANMTAWIAGLASVYDETGTLTLYGTAPSLAFWEWPYWPNATTVAAGEMRELDTSYKAAHKIRAQRVPLLRIQHRVCEEHPGFRVVRGQRPPGAPEVELRPYADGKMLGGVVWSAETYFCPEGLKFLGLDQF